MSERLAPPTAPNHLVRVQQVMHHVQRGLWRAGCDREKSERGEEWRQSSLRVMQGSLSPNPRLPPPPHLQLLWGDGRQQPSTHARAGPPRALLPLLRMLLLLVARDEVLGEEAAQLQQLSEAGLCGRRSGKKGGVGKKAGRNDLPSGGCAAEQRERAGEAHQRVSVVPAQRVPPALHLQLRQGLGIGPLLQPRQPREQRGQVGQLGGRGGGRGRGCRVPFTLTGQRFEVGLERCMKVGWEGARGRDTEGGARVWPLTFLSCSRSTGSSAPPSRSSSSMASLEGRGIEGRGRSGASARTRARGSPGVSCFPASLLPCFPASLLPCFPAPSPCGQPTCAGHPSASLRRRRRRTCRSLSGPRADSGRLNHWRSSRRPWRREWQRRSSTSARAPGPNSFRLTIAKWVAQMGAVLARALPHAACTAACHPCRCREIDCRARPPSLAMWVTQVLARPKSEKPSLGPPRPMREGWRCAANTWRGEGGMRCDVMYGVLGCTLGWPVRPTQHAHARRSGWPTRVVLGPRWATAASAHLQPIQRGHIHVKQPVRSDTIRVRFEGRFEDGSSCAGVLSARYMLPDLLATKGPAKLWPYPSTASWLRRHTRSSSPPPLPSPASPPPPSAASPPSSSPSTPCAEQRSPRPSCVRPAGRAVTERRSTYASPQEHPIAQRPHPTTTPEAPALPAPSSSSRPGRPERPQPAA
jgi:hypothetical protein